MKTYKVKFIYREIGRTFIKASNKDQAMQAVRKELEKNGINNLQYDIKNLEIHIVNANETKN